MSFRFGPLCLFSFWLFAPRPFCNNINSLRCTHHTALQHTGLKRIFSQIHRELLGTYHPSIIPVLDNLGFAQAKARTYGLAVEVSKIYSRPYGCDGKGQAQSSPLFPSRPSVTSHLSTSGGGGGGVVVIPRVLLLPAAVLFFFRRPDDQIFRYFGSRISVGEGMPSHFFFGF